MKTGLVLEGGAMRGMFSCGALDVMMENGVTFDLCVGVSAGAVFGCNLKSGQPGRAIRYNLRFAGDWRYCSLRSWLTTGDLYGVEFCYRTLPRELDPFDVQTFRRSPMEFYAVCTDTQTGEPVYAKIMNGDDADMDWMRASASMPIASRPVKIGGRTYLDGGLSDSIPVEFARRQGCDRIVTVLTQPLAYRKHASKTQVLTDLALRGLPKVSELLRTRPERYNRQAQRVRELEAAGELFVLRPEASLGIGHTEHDPAKLKAVYERGRAAMEARLPAMRAYLAGSQR